MKTTHNVLQKLIVAKEQREVNFPYLNIKTGEKVITVFQLLMSDLVLENKQERFFAVH